MKRLKSHEIRHEISVDTSMYTPRPKTRPTRSCELTARFHNSLSREYLEEMAGIERKEKKEANLRGFWLNLRVAIFCLYVIIAGILFGLVCVKLF